jgi:hypothetical protein
MAAAAPKETLKLLEEALPKDLSSALTMCEEFELEVSYKRLRIPQL